jgi:hypothetical protein
MKTAVEGGYVLVTVGQLANVCAARKAGEISFLSLRVWLATHEQLARRCTATGAVRYTTAELRALFGSSVTERAIAAALRELARDKLLSWSEESIEHPRELAARAGDFASQLGTNHKRSVPIPRRVLRLLFRHKRPSEVMAAIGHLIRCLFKHGTKIANSGLVKASWIASVFGVAERSVHSARKWLIREQILVHEHMHQLVMNRWGAKFIVNLGEKLRPGRGDRPEFAPPSLTKIPYRSTYQRNAQCEYAGKTGVLTKRLPEGQRPSPTLKNILPEDLKQLPRLEELYRQAVQANWLQESEANLRNFVCAALRATRAGGRVGAIFVGIVKRGLWHHITGEQERRALAILARYRDRQQWPGRRTEKRQRPNKTFSTAAELVSTVLNGCGL